jgi:cyclophilin family peptidyl-prolyl cis-trans isomerase
VGTDKRARQKANRDRARQERIRKQKMTKVRKRGVILGVGIPAIVLALFLISRLATGDDATVISATTAPPVSNSAGVVEGETECPKADGTTEGEIVVELNTASVPGTVNNFVALSRYKYYDGSTIFRTDPSIDIIQGGGKTNTDNPGYSIPDEGGPFTYFEGDLVMARGSEPNSGGGQFFFVTGPKASLLDSQGTYVTFGKITKGLDIAKAIMALHKADDSGLGGAPSRTVTVNSVSISEK